MKKYQSLLSGVAMFATILSVTVSAAEQPGCNSEEHYPLITKPELKKVSDSKAAFIVDVNSAESFKEAHVPGAIHFESHLGDFAKLLPHDKGALVVAYCGGVKCGAWKRAAEEACKLGYTNVRHFKEGIQGWVASK